LLTLALVVGSRKVVGSFTVVGAAGGDVRVPEGVGAAVMGHAAVVLPAKVEFKQQLVPK